MYEGQPSREELLKRLEAMTDDEIDFSDIPRITDFSNFRPAKEHLRKVWEHNKKTRINEEQADKQKTLTSGQAI